MARATEATARNFRLPGLPVLDDRMAAVRVDGPVQASLLILLWDAMLCRMLPDRAARLQMRPEGDQQTGPRTVWATGEQEDLVVLPPTSPDRVWAGLYMLTAAQLDFSVHAALWAPYAEQATGTLPGKDLDQHIRSRIPADVLGRPLTHTQAKFLQQVYTTGVPNTRLIMPHLYLSVAPAPWTNRREGLLHCLDGPAVVFGDGSSAYFWRGFMAPPRWFPKPTKEWLAQHPGCPKPTPRGIEHLLPTPHEALRHPNVELRRIAVEMVGWDAVVSSLHPEVLDEDPDPEIGTLLRVQLPAPSWSDPRRTEPHNFLRVRCGTGRTFSLAVPPNVRTARAANAWTYGLEPEDYQPEVRT